MDRFDYTDAELRLRQGLLDEAGRRFEAYMAGHERIAYCRETPAGVLSRHYEVTRRLRPGRDEWETLHRGICSEAQRIGEEINSGNRESLGYKTMQHSVSAEPVHAWSSSPSMRDAWTGQLPHGTELRAINVGFHFPYTPKR